MPDITAFDSTVSMLALAVPFAVLLVLAALLFRPKRGPSRTTSEPPAGTQRGPAPPPPVIGTPGDAAHSAAPLALSSSTPVPLATDPAPFAALEPADAEVLSEDDMIRHIGPIPDLKTPAELHEDIRVAERAGNHALLARLCLDLAQFDPADPHVPELLRKCVRAAMRSKSFAVHAAARLELADRARVAGDLTTACEHWQIARGLFFDMNDRELHKTAEGLMLRHGCPTDWVLTDF